MAQNLLQQIPKMDTVLAHPDFTALESTLPYSLLRDQARARLAALRQDILDGRCDTLPDLPCLIAEIGAAAALRDRPHLRHVINATGVVLHPNLGRAPMGEAVARTVYESALGYNNLEYDIENGCRGSRFSHVEDLLCECTGAEAAMVVNNNAAAVFLMLLTVAAGKKVAISRGELVEIGGSFRVPEIMEQSQAELLEVGTTNKTHLADYRRAIEQGGAEVLLKVHTSNYRIVGFTEEVSLAELVELGREYNIPVLHDLGSGVLRPEVIEGFPWGHTVPESLQAGADLVCFSGDKLLGGPQGGIVAGRRDLIAAMRRNPFARVVRCDKLTLAALEATLRQYRDPALAREQIPTIAMLSATAETLRPIAEGLCARLNAIDQSAFRCATMPGEGEVGGGSLPGLPLPTMLVELEPLGGSADKLEQFLRGYDTPIIARIHRDKLIFDPRTLSSADMDTIAQALTAYAAQIAGETL